MASKATWTDSGSQERIIEDAFREVFCDIPRSLGFENALSCAWSLLAKKIFSYAEYETITGETTPLRRASKLCDILSKKGDTGILAFVDILSALDASKKKIAKAIQDKAHNLGLSKWPGHTYLPASTSMPSLSAEDGLQASKEIRRSGDGPAQDTEYDLSQKPRGQAVIINNVEFEDSKEKLDYRHGSDYDAAALKAAFKKFHFTVTTHRDKTAKELEDILKKVSEDDHSEAGAFVCAVLSHGGPGFVYGVDGEEVEFEKIFQPFNRDNCNSLAGKPKLFFIQACRGDKVDTVRKDGGASTAIKPTRERHWTETWPREADFLIGFATTPSCVSYRVGSDGSFFIQELCKIFKSHPTMELQHMLIRVNREVAERLGEDKKNHPGHYLKQMPSIVNQLTRELRFE